jgi:hypothetical protein
MLLQKALFVRSREEEKKIDGGTLEKNSERGDADQGTDCQKKKK